MLEEVRLEVRLQGQVVAFAPLSPTSKREWELRKTELRSYGRQSIFHLVPARSIVHSRISELFQKHNIHTKKDLSLINPESINEWDIHPQPDTLGGLPVSDVILIIRELAILEGV